MFAEYNDLVSKIEQIKKTITLREDEIKAIEIKLGLLKEEKFHLALDSKDMDESISYSWTTQAIRSIEGLVEPHKMQQLADAVSSAILEAYKLGEKNSLTSRST